MQKECFITNKEVYDIKFGDISYKYHLYFENFDNCFEELFTVEDIDSFFVISDKNIGNLYGENIVRQIRRKYKCELIIFEFTEKNKNFRNMEELIEKVLAKKATRQTCIIGLGGGICGNMSGMVAALLFRGIKFVHIPTSLMAVLDSVLSLKQAINSSFGKNLIGIFHPPEMVITNIAFLKSLPKKEVISGICEVIKNALAILHDCIDKLYETLDSECNYTSQDYHYFIDMSIRAKMLVMKNDQYEKKDALILEYGHTIGHALELYQPGAITHGEAIGLGMMCAAEISHMLGYLSQEEVCLHKKLLEKAGAAIKIPKHIPIDSIISTIKFDNKRGYISGRNNAIHIVLLERIGKPVKTTNKILREVPEAIVRQAINNIYELN